MQNFIGRLTLEQRDELIELTRKTICQVIQKQGVEKCEFYLDEELDWLEGQYLVWNDGDYHCAFLTYGVELIYYPNDKNTKYFRKSPHFEVEKAFFKYMYTVFGEEYKTAYLEHISKLYFE